jgi:hypothetical protein
VKGASCGWDHAIKNNPNRRRPQQRDDPEDQMGWLQQCKLEMYCSYCRTLNLHSHKYGQATLRRQSTCSFRTCSLPVFALCRGRAEPKRLIDPKVDHKLPTIPAATFIHRSVVAHASTTHWAKLTTKPQQPPSPQRGELRTQSGSPYCIGDLSLLYGRPLPTVWETSPYCIEALSLLYRRPLPTV